jgi:tetratricopeptide (TPR) repeat protein/DNA-binding CsgD family transcriptional regulator
MVKQNFLDDCLACLHDESLSNRDRLTEIERVIPLIGEDVDRSVRAKLYRFRGWFYSELTEYNTAHESFLIALELSLLEPPSVDLSASFRGLAHSARGLGNTQECLDYLQRALEVASSLENCEQQAVCHCDLAEFYAQSAVWTMSLDHLHRASELSPGHYYVLLQLANTQLRIGDAATALQITVELLQSSYAGIPLWVVLLLKVKALMQLKRYGEVIETITQSETAPDGWGQGDFLCELGQAYLGLGMAKEGLAALKSATELPVDYYTNWHYRIHYGQVKYQAGLLDEAISDLHLVEANKNEVPEIYTHEIDEYLSQAYEAKGDIVNAHKYLRAHLRNIELRDQSHAIDRLQTLSILMDREHLKHQNEIDRIRHDHLKRELHNTTTALLTQTELLANFRDEIRAAVRKLPPTEPVVKELKEKLKALPCESVDWERFDAQFKAAHPEFVKNLTTTHADLTSMEVRICSLLRSSLKSQDIGRLLCLSDRTVENHRFNIRKKLALARSVDLKVYLQRF